MTRTRSVVVGSLIALFCGVPALFAGPWQSAGPVLFLINAPGIFLAIPHVPPEGYPGQSPFHATLMLLAQAAVWFIVLTVIRLIRD